MNPNVGTRRQGQQSSPGGSPGGPPVQPLPGGVGVPKPGPGPGRKLSPHQQYVQWVQGGRKGASGKNIVPPAGGPGAGAPGAGPGTQPGTPGGPGGPGGGTLSPPGSGFVPWNAGASPSGGNPWAGTPYGNSPGWLLPPPGGQSIPGFAPGFGGQPTGQGPGQFPGQAPAPYAYNNPYTAYLAAIPGMQLQEKKDISGAMEQAGFTGNRFSSTAAEKAGEIGAQTGLQENQLLLQTMYNQSQQDQNRALQAATWGAPSVGGLQNQIAMDKFTVPAQLGEYEQNIAQGNAMNAYNAWNANKLGWFPYLLSAAGGQGAGVPGQIYSVTNPGSTSTLGAIGSMLPGITGLLGVTGLGSSPGGLLGGGSGGGGGKMGGAAGPGQSAGAPTDPGVGG